MQWCSMVTIGILTNIVTKNKGHKQTKCKTCIYWIANTLSKLHTGPSHWQPKFSLETNKEIAFFIIERLEVFKGSYLFDLTILSPLASLLKVFRPIQITWSNFLDTTCSIWHDKKQEYNTSTSPFSISKIFTKNYTHPFCDQPCRLNGLLQSFGVPNIKVLVLEKKDNKT
jgi:hypothetical protein